MMEMTAVMDCNFTPKEVAIIQMSADGLKCAEIAVELHTSEQVIKNIRKMILYKAECANFVQVVATAIRRSIID